jgi:hypothetical protein
MIDMHPNITKKLKELWKNLKNSCIEFGNLTSIYPLQSIVVKDSQIEWDNHFKPRKTSIVEDLMMGGNQKCIL